MDRRHFCKTCAIAGTAVSLPSLSAGTIARAAEKIAQPGRQWEQVVAFLNLDANEVERQLQLRRNGLQVIHPVVLPEEKVGFYGWPHGGIVDETLLVHVRAGALLMRSRDGGNTWEQVRETPHNIYVTGTLPQSGKVVMVAVDREKKNSLSVMASLDKGSTWEIRNVPVKTPRHLTSRIAVHPRFGLITGGHQSSDELEFLVSDDEGESWRHVTFPLPGFYTDGTVVFTWEDKLGVFARGHHGGSDGWSAFTQCYPTNLEAADRFEDLVWEYRTTNIFVAKMDTPDAYYNPVTGRIEAINTKRDAGFPYRDTGLNHENNGQGYMTLNLWSIDPEAFLAGEATWRYEGTIVRSKGEKARRTNPRDGMHPPGSVVDEENGLHHIFIYAGNHAHGDGAPDSGRTGVFCITRSLDTSDWRTTVAALDHYEEIYGVQEDFQDLDRWITTGDPTGELLFQRTEPPERVSEVPLPQGVVETTETGYLHIRTDEPGYYGIHNENCIITKNYKMECKVRVARYAVDGDSLGICVNYGPQKQHLILRSDGLYEAKSPEELQRVTQLAMDHEWHVWSAVMQEGKVRLFLDDAPIGQGAAMTDPSIGHRPVTLYARPTKASDPVEVYVDSFHIDNLER